MTKKKDIFSLFSNAIDSFKNILSNAISFAKEKAKSIIDKSLDFFENLDVTKPYVQKIRKKPIEIVPASDEKPKQSDLEAEDLLKSKRILFDVQEGIISLVEDRVGQYLIVYIRVPEGKIPVFFSPSFVNAKEWIAKNGITNANPKLLKRLKAVKLTIDYTKISYKTQKGKKGYTVEKEPITESDDYEFSYPAYRMRYEEIAVMLYSYAKEEFIGREYTALGSGPGGRPFDIRDLRLFVE